MPEPLLNLLKLLLLALLYLFFLRVLRAVSAEVSGPRVAAPPPVRARRERRGPGRGAKGPPRLSVLEPSEQQGRVFELGDEITVGRAAGCQVTLDDTYVSQLHARVFTRDGAVYVEDLGSTNGTYLNRAKVTKAVAMKAGDHLQVGQTVMELQR